MLQAATELVAQELTQWQHVYKAAMARAATPDFRAAAAAAAAAAVKSAEALPALPLPPLQVEHGDDPSEPADFVTGSVRLNRMQRR